LTAFSHSLDPQRTSGLRSKGGWHSARVVPYLVITASEKGSDALRLFQMMLISLNTHLKVVFLSQAKLFLRQSPRRLTCPHTA
jgi:hypothetical protein